MMKKIPALMIKRSCSKCNNRRLWRLRNHLVRRASEVASLELKATLAVVPRLEELSSVRVTSLCNRAQVGLATEWRLREKCNLGLDSNNHSAQINSNQGLLALKTNRLNRQHPNQCRQVAGSHLVPQVNSVRSEVEVLLVDSNLVRCQAWSWQQMIPMQTLISICQK